MNPQRIEDESMAAIQAAMRGDTIDNPRYKSGKPRIYVHRADRSKLDPETEANHTVIWYGVDPLQEACEQERESTTRFWLIAIGWIIAGIVAVAAISRL